MLDASGRLALPFVECIAGPILLTAPHGLKLCAPRRKHNREKYTTELVLKLAQKLREQLDGGTVASFVVWNYKTARKADPRNLDPNYLTREEWQDSPWHTALLKFRARFRDRGIPCLHVDFHGKNDRRKAKAHRVDVGMAAFEEHPQPVGWSGDDVCELRTAFCGALDEALAGVTLRGKRCVAEGDPVLHGWWGDDCETTLTHQAVLRGIPSLQLENPRSLRNRMMTDDALVERYARAIAVAYRKTADIEARRGLRAVEGSGGGGGGGGGAEAEVKAGTGAMEGKSGEVVARGGSAGRCKEEEEDEAGAAKASADGKRDTEDASAACSSRFSGRSMGAGVPHAFFVYGSLRPDDTSNQPWREDWLEGAASLRRATIQARMFEDEYAAVVLPQAREPGSRTSIVHGYVVEFPTSLWTTKLKDADEIEGCPDLYQRAAVPAVVTASGDTACVWVYHRPDCARTTPVAGGDWVAWRLKNTKQGTDLAAFRAAGCPTYKGQHGGEAFGGDLVCMMDAMLRDIKALDAPNPDRQV